MADNVPITGTIRATPQNPTLGKVASALRSLQEMAGKYQVLPQVPLLGGTSVDELLGLPGAAREVENWSYGNYPVRINPNAGRTASYIPEIKPGRKSDLADTLLLGMDVAPLAAIAKRGTVTGARAIEDATVGALQRARIRSAASKVPEDTAYEPLRQRMEERGNLAYAVKPKGGNWLSGSVDDVLAPLRRSNAPILSGDIVNEAAGRDLFSEYRKVYDQNPTIGLHDWMRTTHPDIYAKIQNPEDRAINRWIDNKLDKYIRNEMATPEDPVRALAERGVLHFQPDQAVNHSWIISAPESRAVSELNKTLGSSDLAKQWEDLADSRIFNAPAARFQEEGLLDELDPWMKPETRLNTFPDPYRVAQRDVAGDLGFTHLIDELREAMHPETTLPRNLRLDPKDVDKLTMAQAVERVAKINAWRAEEAAKAERAGMMANLQATPRMADDSLQLSFVEKPGGAWVDIPETVDDKGMKLCTSIGKAGGWCTQAEWAAKSYGSGENRLTALVDTDGRPHAQAKITESWQSAFDKWYDKMPEDLHQAYVEEFIAKNPQFASRERVNSPEWVQFLVDEKGAPSNKLAPDITELKPPGNSFDSDRAKEYIKRDPQYKQKVTESVLKFLNGGEWGNVKDLHHYDIVDLQDANSLLDNLAAMYGRPTREVAPVFNAAVEANPQAPRFMTQRQLRDFIGPIEPLEGYAGGGLFKRVAGNLGEMASKYAVKQAPTVVEETVETLPKKEAAKNLRKFVRPSAVKQRVYHGSNVPERIVEDKQFTHYSPESSEIHWFSESPEHANEYTYKYLESEGDQGAIFPVNLQIKKPLEIPFNMNQRADKSFKDFIRNLGIYPSEIEEWAQMSDLSKPSKVWQFVNTPVFREMAKRRGYDGLKVQERDFNTWGAFEPTQIKSQFNRGTYDATDPDPGFQAGGIVKGIVKGLGELVEKYIAKEAPQATAETLVKEAPKEQKMLQGFYRGYAGDYDAARAAAQDSGVFVSPQRAVGEYYATKRAAQTGLDPHLEMILADPFAGRGYGHSTMGTGKKPPMVTRARELKPEDVQDRTKLYAEGGAVNYDPAEIEELARSIVPGYAAGGLVHYDPTEIDTIVSRVKEEFHG